MMHKRGRLWLITFIAGTIYYSLITFLHLFATKLNGESDNLPFFTFP